MIRYLLALILLFVAVPAAAQADKGCYNYSGQNIWTAKSVEKLRADIACFIKAKGIIDISIKAREMRIAQLTPPTNGDKEPPKPTGYDTTIPASVPTPGGIEPLLGWSHDYIGLPGGPKRGDPPPSAAPDVVGAFRFLCGAGQISRDDPIVFPGQPGKSHLHQFFGNTLANANSTYQSLRSTGMSTCNNILNRSAYWMPAMLNGKGGVVRPDYVSIYYKRRPESDPSCQKIGKACVGIPRGLRYVFGYDMQFGTPETGGGYYDCQGAGATPGHYPDLVAVAKNCPAGAQLGAIIGAPNCWDGKNLDSPDHRSHVAYVSYGNWGYEKCPDTHPYVVPAFTMGAWYTVDADLDTSGQWDGSKPTWHLSSDEMPGMPMMKPGSTFHADWFGAWDDDVMKMWMDNCINKMLNCSGGELGNGRTLKGMPHPFLQTPRVVPVP